MNSCLLNTRYRRAQAAHGIWGGAPREGHRADKPGAVPPADKRQAGAVPPQHRGGGIPLWRTREHADHCSEEGPHFLPDTDNYETPPMEFRNKEAQKRSGRATRNGWMRILMTSGPTFRIPCTEPLFTKLKSTIIRTCRGSQ